MNGTVGKSDSQPASHAGTGSAQSSRTPAGGRPGVRIQKYLVKDLAGSVSEINGPRAASGGRIVLPEHAAIACSKNPCADDKDMGFLVARVGNEVAGYLGLMPGMFSSGDNHFKVHWLTTWHVFPEHRQSGAGAMLMMTAMGLGYHLLASAPGMGEDARHVYQRLGFAPLGPLTYRFVDCEKQNPWHWPVRQLECLQQRMKRRLRGLGRLREVTTSLHVGARRKFWGALASGFNDRANRVEFRTVKAIDQRVLNDLSPASVPHFSRDASVLNWMLTYKWILPSSQATIQRGEYQFSSYRTDFTYIPFEMYRTGRDKPEGLAIISVSTDAHRTIIKLLDCHLRDPESSNHVLGQLCRYAQEFSASELHVPPDWLPRLSNRGQGIDRVMNQRTIYYFAKASPRAREASELFRSARLELYDGDMAFY